MQKLLQLWADFMKEEILVLREHRAEMRRKYPDLFKD